MQNELANRIEAYLLAAKGWVSADDLCAAFNVTKRQLRARDDQPGLCSQYAISGTKGFRHVVHCTQAEFDHACHRITKHADAEKRRETQLRHKRATTRLPRPAPIFERDSDQALLLT